MLRQLMLPMECERTVERKIGRQHRRLAVRVQRPDDERGCAKD
jgi:hypothetical protein